MHMKEWAYAAHKGYEAAWYDDKKDQALYYELIAISEILKAYVDKEITLAKMRILLDEEIETFVLYANIIE